MLIGINYNCFYKIMIMRVSVSKISILVLVLIFSCTKDEEPEVYQIQSGTFTDERGYSGAS